MRDQNGLRRYSQVCVLHGVLSSQTTKGVSGENGHRTDPKEGGGVGGEGGSNRRRVGPGLEELLQPTVDNEGLRGVEDSTDRVVKLLPVYGV